MQMIHNDLFAFFYSDCFAMNVIDDMDHLNMIINYVKIININNLTSGDITADVLQNSYIQVYDQKIEECIIRNYPR
jgi:hypothetical protein